MDLAELLYQRRSVRDFAVEPVSREVLTQLIDAAIQAPSAMNEQPWHFSVVTDKGQLSRISERAKAYLMEEFGEGSHMDHIRQTLGDPQFQIFYHAPALVVISAPKSAQWAVEDCALAAENLMLAAQAMKLGTCWIGFAQSWLNTDDGRAAIGLDETQMPVAPIIVGHPKHTPPAVPRRKPNIKWIG
ncbi:MAG TPA: nitroreductase family protein [Rhizomicrobium sp.]|nr:nitroreductase family protein [Rhizomicrobium sp.]